MVPSTTSEQAASVDAILARQEASVSSWTWLALVVAWGATAGSLALSLGLAIKACPLCLYQRTFVMAAAAVLMVGLLLRMRPVSALSLLALPLAVGGLGVGLFHEWLELTGKLECPAGFLGLGTAPQQALVAQVLLTGLLIGDGVRRSTFAVLGCVVLGAALAAGAMVSAPPMPAAPTRAYEKEPDVCRPPFRPA